MAELRFTGGDLIFTGGELSFSDNCCCEACTISWAEFQDDGCIAGGQDGAHREYATPGSVSNSPWAIITSPASGLRFSFEDSADDEARNISTSVPPQAGPGHGESGPGCASYNHFRQVGTAVGAFTLATDGYLAIEWEGVAEQEDDYFELMRVSVDGTIIASATSPGGNLDCADMAPVLSYPPSPVYFPLTAGAHTIVVEVDSGDSWFHVDAYYQFTITCDQAPTGECCLDVGGPPTASFDISDEEAECSYVFTSTSTAGTCGSELECEWEFVVSGSVGNRMKVFTATGCEVAITFRDCELYTGGRFTCLDVDQPACGDLTIEVTLRVTSDEGCVGIATETVVCLADCNPSGTVSATSTGVPCQYEFCAAVDIDNTCPDPFVEIRITDGGTCLDPNDIDCTCSQLFTDPELYCHPCMRRLSDGECFTITLDETSTYQYRWWTDECGCYGPWSEPVELICSNCSCCEDTVTGVLVTISGTGQGDVPGCDDCDIKIDGSYFVPFSAEFGGCGGSLTVEDAFSCDGGPENLYISIAITCFEGAGPGGQDVVEVSGVVQSPSLSQVDFYELSLYPPGSLPIDCLTELDGSLPNLYFGSSPWPAPCSGSSMVMELDFQ